MKNKIKKIRKEYYGFAWQCLKCKYWTIRKLKCNKCKTKLIEQKLNFVYVWDNEKTDNYLKYINT